MGLRSVLTLSDNRQLTMCPIQLRMLEYHEVVCLIIIIFVLSAVVERGAALRHSLI
jgi:hypothetical protein